MFVRMLIRLATSALGFCLRTTAESANFRLSLMGMKQIRLSQWDFTYSGSAIRSAESRLTCSARSSWV